jgi:hypothetical protein
MAQTLSFHSIGHFLLVSDLITQYHFKNSTSSNSIKTYGVPARSWETKIVETI